MKKERDVPIGRIKEADFATGRGVIEFEGEEIPFSWKDVVNHSMKGLEPETQVIFHF